MPSIPQAVQWAIQIANDETHGYDQANRYGPDYDCSSFVCTALAIGGFNISPTNTTSTMLQTLRSLGFVNCEAPFRAGDIHLAVGHHTAMQINTSQLVQASENEYGTATGGQTGDQTGQEIWVTRYYDFPWDYHLRYNGGFEHDFIYKIGDTTSGYLTGLEQDNNILAIYERMSAYGWSRDAIIGMCGCFSAESNYNPGVYESRYAESISNLPYFKGGMGLAQWTDYPAYTGTYPNPLPWHAQQENKNWWDGEFQCYLFTRSNDRAYTSMGFGQGPRWGWQESPQPTPQNPSVVPYPSIPFDEYIVFDQGHINAMIYWLFCFELHYMITDASIGTMIQVRTISANHAKEVIDAYYPDVPKPTKKKGMPLWMMIRYR